MRLFRKNKPDPVEILRDPATIRERARLMLELAKAGKLDYVRVDMNKLPGAQEYLKNHIQGNYPDPAKIPYHSRWQHFKPGNIDRWGQLQQQFAHDDKTEISRRAIDLAVVSVLLDAGAGDKWAYSEKGTGVVIGRSEGLAVASFHLFKDGLFSSDPANPCRVDAAGLAALDVEKLKAGLQVSDKNPMNGLEGRIELVRKLAEALNAHPEFFGKAPARPGNIIDYLGNAEHIIRAPDILAVVLEGFSSIWPGRITLNGQNLGDVWEYPKLYFKDKTSGKMPFHKLSQWLTYSLLEPFEWAGYKVVDIDKLTGLSEYRNIGFLMETGVLAYRKPEYYTTPFAPQHPAIIELRACTLALLEQSVEPVAKLLQTDPEKFTLAHMLQGGTWSAGRALAAERDPEKRSAPFQYKSDGTVF